MRSLFSKCASNKANSTKADQFKIKGDHISHYSNVNNRMNSQQNVNDLIFHKQYNKNFIVNTFSSI